MHDLHVHANRVDHPVAIPEAFDLGGRNTGRSLSFRDPIVDHPSNLSVLADEDEDGWPGVISIRFPILGVFLPQPAKHCDRMMTVCVGFGFGVAIEIHRGPAPGHFFRRLAFFDSPVLLRLFVRRVEYGFWNFVIAHC